jgi:multidrug efflux pump subunit AcrB
MNDHLDVNGWTTLFYRNRHLLGLSILVILVAGASSLISLPRLEDPIITTRNALILTAYPGASAGRVESIVSEPIEQRLKEIPAIKTVETTSRGGISIVAVELKDNVTPSSNQPVFSEIRDRLAEASALFPAGVLPPVFDEKRGAVAYTLIAAVSWADGSEELLGVPARQSELLADRLRNIPGTELVRVFGQVEEEILASIDPVGLAGLGLNLSQVAAALQTSDSKVPAGTLRADDANLQIEVRGDLDSVARVREVPLRKSLSGRIARLGDIATISRSVADPPSSIGRINGRRAIFVAARISPDIRIDRWAAAASRELDSFAAQAGGGIAVDTVFDQNTYTSQRLGDLAINLLLGAVVVFLVILLSMGWRSALIVSSSLPLTAALTLFVVTLQGGKLHQMSIFGMIIALGLLVDNAIVVTDEIRKHLRAGCSGLLAVHLAVRHLFIPLFASTLTTILAFLPILLLPGNAGDFVSSIGESVIIALACSFFIAIAIVAALAGMFGSNSGTSSRLPSWLVRGMEAKSLASIGRKMVTFAVHQPVRALLLSCLFPFVGFAIVPTLGMQFFPRTDRNMFEIQTWLPTEASLARTDALTRKIESSVRQQPGVTNVFWQVGASFPPVYYNLIANRDNSPHYAQAIVEASDSMTVRELIRPLQTLLDRSFPEAQIVVRKFAQGPPAPSDVEIRVSGPSIAMLQDLGEQIRLAIASHPGVLQSQMSIVRGEPQLWFEASEEQSSLPLTALAAELQANLDGIQAGFVLEEIESLPVRIRYATNARNDIGEIESINFPLPDSSRWIPLSAIGKISLRPQQGGITRRNGERTNNILAYTADGVLPIDVTRQALDTLERSGFQLPAGYRMEVGGEAENQAEAVGNLMTYLPIIVVATIATLILTFRSVPLALLLLVVAPMSVGFGMIGTALAGFPLSFNTLLGSLGLMGLAFNSSIIVLAAILADPSAKAGNASAIADCILASGRHLTSTTLTTMGSFLPILIFIGGEFWPPLAIVFVAGVGGSTLLAVFFTPAAYGLLLRFGYLSSRKAENPI